MKQYPQIDHWNKGILGEHVYAFDKYDGSNLRSTWNLKLSKKTSFTNGFGKFGTRTQLTHIKDENWGLGVKIFMDKYSEGLDKIFREDKDFRNAREVTVFFEYFGPNSFAGWHDINDKNNNKMDVILFDVDVFQKGLMIAKKFIEKFEHLHIPPVIYEGNYNQKLIDDVRNNVYNLNEGVVCKGYRKVKNNDIVWMSKIKTINWLEKVKGKFGEKKLLEELNNDQLLYVNYNLE